MTTGWSSIDDIETNKEFQPRPPSDDEIVIAKVFKGEIGEKALDALRRLTIEKPSLQNMFPDGVNTAIAMALREGENNLYRKILSIIKKVDSHGHRKS